MQSLYFVKLQTGRGQMTEERTGNNSPGVWHRHLCVLWTQVDSCLLPPLPLPPLSLAPPECGRRGRTGDRGHLTGTWGSIQSGEKCFELWLWSWIITQGRGLMWVSPGVRLASPHLSWPARASDETFFFVLTVQQKSVPARTLWPLEQSAPFCSTFYPGLAYLSPGSRECCKYKLSCGMCQCV